MAKLIIIITVAILIISNCAQNQPPQISAIQVIPENIKTQDSVQIKAVALDPEKGRLIYQWSANGGSFGMQYDSIIIWYAPQIAGKYKIRLQVSDVFNARSRKNIFIQVNLKTVPDALDSIYEPQKGTKMTRPLRRPGGRQTKTEQEY